MSLLKADQDGGQGLVTTKTSQIEPLEQIKLLPRGASSLVGAERLTISPQCDFATSGAGNAHL